jgi:ferredoxin-fold anticodon binding domain-containing protein
LACEVLLHEIERRIDYCLEQGKPFPRKLYLQIDGGPENTHKVFYALCEDLVRQGVFDSIEAARLPVGHTHEDIDAMFGVLWRAAQGKTIVTLGKIKKEWQQKFDIKQEVYIALIDWKVWTQLAKFQSDVYQELPKTFQSRRDFSLLIDDDITHLELVNAAHKASPKLLKDTQLFDVYEGDKLEKGKKSYAMAFYFQDIERTLTDVEIDAEMHQIRESLSKNLGARLR